MANFVNAPIEMAGWSLSYMGAYRVFVGLLAVVVCPFCFMDLTNTKVVQYATMAPSWW
jgi:hypothetical protein